jgi:hypothetical protein
MPDDLRNPDIAAAFAESVLADAAKPRIQVLPGNLPATARLIQQALADEGLIFERGGPVFLKKDQMTGTLRALPMTVESVIVAVSRVCQLFELHKKKDDFEERDVTCSVNLAKLILLGGEWALRPLNGITSAPILDDSGGIRCAEGYDDATGMWCQGVPDVAGLVPPCPTEAQAREALHRLRAAFRTFPYADAARHHDPALGVDIVDLRQPPTGDETALLCGILTAICRPSLELAPMWMVRAPSMSGAGSGKGLLVRAINEIAFGRPPQTFTGGHDAGELDKRLVSELIEAAPGVALDNANNLALASHTLDSALTEKPARVRPLGSSVMVPLNCSAFMTITGNGLSVCVDLVRRTIELNLDPGMEDPESRPFRGDFLGEIRAQRAELLTAALTLWRWGRLHPDLPAGRSLGSYEAWGRWCRDPLAALGCADPVARIQAAKATDTRRQQVMEIFAAWFERHHDYPVRVADLHESVTAIIDPSGRGSWQFARAHVEKLVGTRINGMFLTVSKPAGRHGAATYSLRSTST